MKIWSIVKIPQSLLILVCVVVDPATGDAYGMIGDNLIKTSDHGETWTTLTDNLVGHPILGGAGIFANGILLVGVDSGRIQVSNDGNGRLYIGIFYSDNSDAITPIWTSIETTTPLSSVRAVWDGALAIAVSGGNDVVYVGVGSGGNETGIYRFDGADWEKLDEDFNGLYVNDILVHPEDNDIVFVSCEAASTVGSLYKSTNGGLTFATVTNGLEGTNHLGAMTAKPGDTTTIYLASQRQRLTSTLKDAATKIVWKPKSADRAEYTRTSSRIITIH